MFCCKKHACTELTDQEKENLLPLFIGEKRQQSFMDAYNKMSDGKKFVLGFNPIAFLLLPVWLVYRKIYALFWAFLLLAFLPDMLEMIWPSLSDPLLNAVDIIGLGLLLIAACACFFSRPLYIRYALCKIACLKSKSESDEDLKEAVAKRGGVNLIAAWSVTLIIFAYLTFGILAILQDELNTLDPAHLQEPFDQGKVAYQEQRYDDAALWFQMAAERGSAVAQVRLAFLYTEGKGVPFSLRESWYWAARAAEQNFPGARELMEKAEANMTDVDVAVAKYKLSLWQKAQKKATAKEAAPAETDTSVEEAPVVPVEGAKKPAAEPVEEKTDAPAEKPAADTDAPDTDK